MVNKEELQKLVEEKTKNKPKETKKMTYHIGCDENGTILAGTRTKAGKWGANVTDVTQDALAAVRDHLLALSRRENQNIAYAWQLDDGKSIALKLEVVDKINEEQKSE